MKTAIILFCLLFVSGVSANEDIVDLSDSTNISHDLKSTILNNTNCTIILPNKTVSFDCTIHIPYPKNIKIKSNGILSIIGVHNDREVFNVNGGDLCLSNIEFSSLSRVIQVNQGNLTCDNCAFNRNEMCIDARESRLRLNNCHLFNNSNSLIKLGMHSTLDVDSCTFDFNDLSSAYDKKASCILGNGMDYNVSISKCNFAKNKARYGAALSFDNCGGNYICNISDCTFNNNYADSQGGVLFTDGSSKYLVNLTGNTFAGNSANLNSDGFGGVIFASGRGRINFKYTLRDNIFTKNKAVHGDILAVIGNNAGEFRGGDNKVNDGSGKINDHIYLNSKNTVIDL